MDTNENKELDKLTYMSTHHCRKCDTVIPFYTDSYCHKCNRPLDPIEFAYQDNKNPEKWYR